MMPPSLTRQAAKWFDQPDRWFSFLELIVAQSAIMELWFNHGSVGLRKAWKGGEAAPQWDFEAWDGFERDTWWYLREFGPDSVGVGFGWRFQWCVGAVGNRIDRAELSKLLVAPEYGSLATAFGPIHPQDSGYMTWVQVRSFYFDHPNDGKLSEAELAWYAGNRTEDFVEQALAKVRAFTHDTAVTALLTRLNRELLR